MFNSIKPAPQNTFNSIKPQITWFYGLYIIRQWLNNLEIQNVALAHFICRMIPTQCPFERDICFFGRTILHIPPLCKLNPLYANKKAFKIMICNSKALIKQENKFNQLLLSILLLPLLS